MKWCGEKPFDALDFFAGAGLAAEALKPFFRVVWANDICPRKAAVFRANNPNGPYLEADVATVKGRAIQPAVLSWASFPCQDLSLAGNLEGIESHRSGLVWQWLRVMDEMPKRPPLLVAENVIGLLSAASGAHYLKLHKALRTRGYHVGAVVLDAIRWLPQSRPRVFVIAVDKTIDHSDLTAPTPLWCHPRAVQRASVAPGWVWWRLPEPRAKPRPLTDLVDFSAPCDPPGRAAHNLSLIPESHRRRLDQFAGDRVFPGYKRTRKEGQVLELRFDGVAGCLRTPRGGSSRQLLVLRDNGSLSTRLLTVRETASLMGAPSTFTIVGTYNDGYKAMGDAVAVPVVRHLTRHLLAPLAKRAHEHRR